MSSRRVLKVAEAIREVVGMAILTELQDPRIRDVTVTYVEVSADLRYAKVHVSVMGSETKQNLSLRGLQNAAGFLQQKVARRIETRYTPKLTFLLDKGVKHSIEVSRLLSELLPPTNAEAPADEAPEGVTDEAAVGESIPSADHGQQGRATRIGDEAATGRSIPSEPEVGEASLEQDPADAGRPEAEERPELGNPQ